MKRIAIVGEFYNSFEPHMALNKALSYLKESYDFEFEWLDTESVNKKRGSLLSKYNGIWSAPGSPFKSLDGALYAVTHARENSIPHIGTCAGFQHSIIEIARNILGIKDAQHEEYESKSSTLFVNKLVCSLAGKEMDVFLSGGTKTEQLYSTKKTTENYYCNFAINPDFKNSLDHPNIKITGVDQDDEIRIIELTNHPFFIITLFVPQTKSTKGNPHPLIKGFIETICGS
jgi:CTP synthase (UTP-ammonia lyase)